MTQPSLLSASMTTILVITTEKGGIKANSIELNHFFDFIQTSINSRPSFIIEFSQCVKFHWPGIFCYFSCLSALAITD
ncbi:hypothetical protein VNO78_08655 [Psophocarpus tetragonolobus]|uniref:Uncharacterized protein n=1 Tax=Psophocarpus tetragonolobus TaxID=3891 RepID=A0AAN9SYC3_PSOTE